MIRALLTCLRWHRCAVLAAVCGLCCLPATLSAQVAAHGQLLSTLAPQRLPGLQQPAPTTGYLELSAEVSAAPQTSPAVASSPTGGASQRRLRPAVLASAGLALTGAVVAYWSAHEADAAYDRYLHSAGSVRQQKALDRAEGMDRLAGAGFLVMEAGLVLTARFVFF